jgi:hypothetical protein
MNASKGGLWEHLELPSSYLFPSSRAASKPAKKKPCTAENKLKMEIDYSLYASSLSSAQSKFWMPLC